MGTCDGAPSTAHSSFCFFFCNQPNEEESTVCFAYLNYEIKMVLYEMPFVIFDMHITVSENIGTIISCT